MKAEAKLTTAPTLTVTPDRAWAMLTRLLLAGTWWLVCGCSNAPPVENSPSITTSTGTNSAGESIEPKPEKREPNPSAVTITEAVPAPSPPQTSSTTDKQFDPERLKFAMVAVGTASDGWFGYGVVLDRSSTGFDVVTADHVITDRTKLMIQAWQGDQVKSQLQTYSSVTIMHRSPAKDLAWLRVRANDSHVLPLSIAQSMQLDNQPAWTYEVQEQRAIFAAHEIEKRVTAQRDKQAVPVAYLRLKKRIEAGLSGGGLVDAHGHWIGIASGNGDNQAHYLAPPEIASFLKEAGLK